MIQKLINKVKEIDAKSKKSKSKFKIINNEKYILIFN